MNALSDGEAAAELLRCCGSTRWARMMAAARPFVSAEAIAVTADVIWEALPAPDWLEAFAAHPRIGAGGAGGAGRAGRAGGPGRDGGAEGTEKWAAEEQSGVTDAARARFVAMNRDYEDRFGHIFIVCATGKSADEMLDILQRRMRNSPNAELREAAEQQRQITRIRLDKLMAV